MGKPSFNALYFLLDIGVGTDKTSISSVFKVVLEIPSLALNREKASRMKGDTPR
jgi:hypothetical protein